MLILCSEVVGVLGHVVKLEGENPLLDIMGVIGGRGVPRKQACGPRCFLQQESDIGASLWLTEEGLISPVPKCAKLMESGRKSAVSQQAFGDALPCQQAARAVFKPDAPNRAWQIQGFANACAGGSDPLQARALATEAAEMVHSIHGPESEACREALVLLDDPEAEGEAHADPCTPASFGFTGSCCT